jgi:hypothetical protein
LSSVTSGTGATEGAQLKYLFLRFDLKMTWGQSELEQFFNGLEGEIVSKISNVT